MATRIIHLWKVRNRGKPIKSSRLNRVLLSVPRTVNRRNTQLKRKKTGHGNKFYPFLTCKMSTHLGRPIPHTTNECLCKEYAGIY